jgi:transglutaminase-like putative cysteine protease
MRFKLRHEIVRRYEPPALSVIQLLRASPRNHEGQHVFGWRIDPEQTCRLAQSEDAFGNITHAFTLDGPIEQHTILVEGEVETQDTAGIVRGAIERLPPALFLRQTEATQPSIGVIALAKEIRATNDRDALSELHALLRAVNERVALDPAQDRSTAAAALEHGRGTATGMAHLFLGCARQLGHPARYVSGYVAALAGNGQGVVRGWAEAYVARIGWIGFDAVERLCTTESHIRIAVALDELGAGPLRSSAYRAADEGGADIVTLREIGANGR